MMASLEASYFYANKFILFSYCNIFGIAYIKSVGSKELRWFWILALALERDRVRCKSKAGVDGLAILTGFNSRLF